MPNRLNFLPYQAEHLDFVTRLYNHYVLHSTATYHVQALTADELCRYLHLEQAEVKTYIMECKAVPTGFCLIKPYSPKEGYKYTYEVTIYLRPEYCRQGLGAEALQYLEIVAREHGIHVLIAGICAENQGSIRLFERCNYVRCGYFKDMGFKFNRYLDNVYYQKVI